MPVWHIGEGEEVHQLEPEQAGQDNNEELHQDVNDTWDWYYEGEEGQHEVNYMEENWNDQQQAHLIRHSGLFYLRAEKIDIPTGFDIYRMTTDNGN